MVFVYTGAHVDSYVCRGTVEHEVAHATVLRRAGARDEAGRPSRRGATMVFCKEAHALSDRHTQV